MLALLLVVTLSMHWILVEGIYFFAHRESVKVRPVKTSEDKPKIESFEIHPQTLSKKKQCLKIESPQGEKPLKNTHANQTAKKQAFPDPFKEKRTSVDKQQRPSSAQLEEIGEATYDVGTGKALFQCSPCPIRILWAT